MICPEGYEEYEGRCPKCGEDGLFDYRKAGPHIAVYCMWCGAFVQHVPKIDPKKRLSKWKKRIKERDKYTCQRCGLVANSTQLDAHHKIPVWFMPDLQYDMDNGITLCKVCHHALHGAAGTIKEKEIKENAETQQL